MGHPVIVDINKVIAPYGYEIVMQDATDAPHVANRETTAGANTCAVCGRKLPPLMIVVPCMRATETGTMTQRYLCLNLKECAGYAQKVLNDTNMSLTSKLDSLQKAVILPGKGK